MHTATASHLAVLGCPADCHAEVTAMAIPHQMLTELEAGLPTKRINWIPLLAFLRKYGSLVPQITAAFAVGSWPAVLAFVAAQATNFPQMLADFLAIFA